MVAEPDLTWDELLEALSERTGMYVTYPRLLGCAALLNGYSLAMGDQVMRGFQTWVSQRFPEAGGYPNPLVFESLVAQDLFSKAPRELSEEEDQAACERLCELVREFRASATPA